MTGIPTVVDDWCATSTPTRRRVSIARAVQVDTNPGQRRLDAAALHRRVRSKAAERVAVVEKGERGAVHDRPGVDALEMLEAPAELRLHAPPRAIPFVTQTQLAARATRVVARVLSEREELEAVDQIVSNPGVVGEDRARRGIVERDAAGEVDAPLDARIDRADLRSVGHERCRLNRSVGTATSNPTGSPRPLTRSYVGMRCLAARSSQPSVATSPASAILPAPPRPTRARRARAARRITARAPENS